MTKKAILLIGSLFVFALLLFGAIVNGYTDYTAISTPGNPATGYARLFVNSSTNLLNCLLSSGSSCMPVFQTNGTSNSSQAALNLVAGTNVTLTPSGSSVTIAASGGGGGSGALTQIAQQALSSSASSVTFSSIPGTYTNLQLWFTARSSTTGNPGVNCQMNGDTTGSHYSWQYFYASGSGTGAGQNTQSSSGEDCFTLVSSNGPSNSQTGGVMNIPGYAQTTYNKVLVTSYNDWTGTGYSSFRWVNIINEWASTSAITQIVLTPTSGSFATGSVFTLYGVQ